MLLYAKDHMLKGQQKESWPEGESCIHLDKQIHAAAMLSVSFFSSQLSLLDLLSLYLKRTH